MVTHYLCSQEQTHIWPTEKVDIFQEKEPQRQSFPFQMSQNLFKNTHIIICWSQAIMYLELFLLKIIIHHNILENFEYCCRKTHPAHIKDVFAGLLQFPCWQVIILSIVPQTGIWVTNWPNLLKGQTAAGVNSLQAVRPSLLPCVRDYWNLDNAWKVFFDDNSWFVECITAVL